MDTLVDNTEAGIARRIRLERDARGWSQAELADKSGVAKASISKIERGLVQRTHSRQDPRASPACSRRAGGRCCAWPR